MKYIITTILIVSQAAYAAVTLTSKAVIIKTVAPVGTADWNTRISGPGVVWYHNFDTAAEVNAFRWTGGKGNDPQANGTSIASRTSWVSTGGATGGAYLQISRPAGTSEVPDWWRPFSPIKGSSNGRGVDDPGANGTITPQVFNSSYTGELESWQGKAKPGWYGHSSYQNSFFDGTDFYIQVRVKVDPRRMAEGNFEGGKRIWITTTSGSYTNQELVTVGQYRYSSGTGVGVPNYHQVYQGYNYAGLADVAVPAVSGTRIQIGSEKSGICDPYERVNVSGCWSYSTGWDTLLYHVTPGRDGVAEARFEVWAVHPGESKYTKIWDVTYPARYEQGNASGGPYRNGWNGLILSAYSNGFQGRPLTEFTESYDQVIFSKQFIPVPAQ